MIVIMGLKVNRGGGDWGEKIQVGGGKANAAPSNDQLFYLVSGSSQVVVRWHVGCRLSL